PGATAFTVTPAAALSIATARASPTIPALAAAYAGSPRIAIDGPVTDATMTTLPQPAARMAGRTARVVRNAVPRFRAIAASHCCGVRAVTSPDSAPELSVAGRATLVIPALLTRTATGPRRCVAP